MVRIPDDARAHRGPAVARTGSRRLTYPRIAVVPHAKLPHQRRTLRMWVVVLVALAISNASLIITVFGVSASYRNS